MYKLSVCAFCALLITATVAMAQSPQYKIGRPAIPEEIHRLDITVFPDGTGLPAGGGTVGEGQTKYLALCANCHGEKGEGVVEYPSLVGGRDTLRGRNPVLTVGSYWPYATTVWDYIHRAMPYQRPGTLSVDETYALTAFILYMNGIVDKKAILNEKTLPQVKMPNRDGFIADPRPDVPIRKPNTGAPNRAGKDAGSPRKTN